MGARNSHSSIVHIVYIWAGVQLLILGISTEVIL